jgi:hypothetical protein
MVNMMRGLADIYVIPLWANVVVTCVFGIIIILIAVAHRKR